MSDNAQSQKNRSSDYASRSLVGALGTFFGLLAICIVALTIPCFVRAMARLETARQQRVAVDRTIEKRMLPRRPKLRECWIDCEALKGIGLHDNHGTTWADLQPLSGDLKYTPPPEYTTVAPVVAVPFARSPICSPTIQPTSHSPVQRVQRPHQPYQRPWTPKPDSLVQLTFFVAMPTPSRPLYSPRAHPYSRHLASTSTSPSPPCTYHDLTFPDILTSPYTQQELTLGLTMTPFIPDLRPSLPSSTAEEQKQPGPS